MACLSSPTYNPSPLLSPALSPPHKNTVTTTLCQPHSRLVSTSACSNLFPLSISGRVCLTLLQQDRGSMRPGKAPSVQGLATFLQQGDGTVLVSLHSADKACQRILAHSQRWGPGLVRNAELFSATHLGKWCSLGRNLPNQPRCDFDAM